MPGIGENDVSAIYSPRVAPIAIVPENPAVLTAFLLVATFLSRGQPSQACAWEKSLVLGKWTVSLWCVP